MKKLVMSRKTDYHPMLMLMYYSGCLDDRVLREIPLTTIQYWRTKDHTTMFGYELVKNQFENFKDFEVRRKKSISTKALLVGARIIHTFSKIYVDSKGYRRLLRRKAKEVVKTIDDIRPQIKLSVACKIFHISQQQFYRWKNQIHCSASVLNLCFKTHPTQLSVQECQLIEDHLHTPAQAYVPKLTIYYNLLRKEQLFCGMSTFYKYARLLYQPPEFQRIERPPSIFRATRPFEYIHIDTTKVFTELEGFLRVVFVKDNYSKSLLYYFVAPDASSYYIKEVLHETFKKYGLFTYKQPVNVIFDDGTENKGEVYNWFKKVKKRNVVKIIAKKEATISNNMVESCNHMFKNKYLPGKKLIRTNEDLEELLKGFQKWYNIEWKPGEFYGLSPFELLLGEIPNKYRFTDQIKQALEIRKLYNQLFPVKACKQCGMETN